MVKSKKGALELSVNTIVVIVIGVTLLTLGLVFVNTLFKNISAISDNTFNRANELLEGIENVDKPLTIIPSEIDIEQGKDDVVKVILYNQNENELSLNVKILTAEDDDKIDCYLYDKSAKLTKNAGPYEVASGKQQSLTLIVKDNKGALRTTACSISVEGLPQGEDNEETLVLKVVES